MNTQGRKAKSKRHQSLKSVSGLPVLTPHAAGIDLGSREHWVAVPEDRDADPIRPFGCYTNDLKAMIEWLHACRIQTIAMEATGVYWFPVHDVLEEAGFEVVLVNARHYRAVKARKTDVVDARWLQQLHEHGLLKGSLVPELEVRAIRELWRLRNDQVRDQSRQVQMMQKALEQMNIQLHKAVSDLQGDTAMRIIRAIAAGERDARVLARHRDPRCKNSEETIAKALTGNWREEYLFCLVSALRGYDFQTQQVRATEVEIGQRLRQSVPQDQHPTPEQLGPPSKKLTRLDGLDPEDLRALHYAMAGGVDLTDIPGINVLTVQTLLAEYGADLSKFPTGNHFASHLGLTPEPRITGGRVKSTATRKVKSETAKALRIAAQSLRDSHTMLGAYFRRMKARLGPAKAVTATARKLAVLIHRLLTTKQAYNELGEQPYLEQFRDGMLRSLRKRAKQLGHKIVPIDVTAT